MNDQHATHDDPVETLVATAAVEVPAWLERCVVVVATRQLGACPDELHAAAVAMAHRVGPSVVTAIAELVRADVDSQRATPLTILRGAVRHPTAVLVDAGVPTVARDDFAVQHFPGDVYGLAPAAWVDVAPAMHDAGIMWGVWKAATVMRRHR